MKDYREYYTPSSIAEFLIKDYVLTNNFKVIDICCGSSNLLRAANEINRNVKLTGVDLNINYIDESLDCEYIEADGRKFAIDSYKNNRKFDLVLANPPFELDKEKSFYIELCECDNNFKEIRYINLLTEMILANLLLLNDNGKLLIILPSSVLLGNRFTNLRKLLMNQYTIEKIWNLPEFVFQGNEIDTYALQISMKKNMGATCSYFEVQCEDGMFDVKDSSNVDLKKFVQGTWKLNKKSEGLFKENIEIIRGSISSNQFTDNGVNVLHVAKRNDNDKWEPKHRLFKPIDGKIYKQVDEGDIIVSRIGRDSGQIHNYQGKGDYISDCLLIIKGIEYKKLKAYLQNNYMCDNFSFLKKGTTSKYVSKKDIMSLFV